jgi:hypothetical protein
MSEIGKPHPETVETKEGIDRTESRFGDKEMIIQMMLEGKARSLGNIEELVDDIAPHENKLELVGMKNAGANTAEYVVVQTAGGDELVCVFKPQSGENQAVKKELGIPKFYPRECAAYMISEHFGFDIVPPTVVREIDGRIGSLQLFLDHNMYRDLDSINRNDNDAEEKVEEMKRGRDYGLMALLDWVSANNDRKYANFMARRNNVRELVAIDHGVIMDSNVYANHEIRGPSLDLTWDNEANRSRSVDLPDDIIELMKAGLAQRESLDTKLESVNGPDGVSPREVELMWERVRKLIETKKYLSHKNYSAVVGKGIGEIS